MTKLRSFICGIKGTQLSIKEINFLKKFRPWGIILFSRNIKTIQQPQLLTKNIKMLFNNNNIRFFWFFFFLTRAPLHAWLI